MKNGLICVVIVAVLSLCMFNSVAAAPVSKLTPGTYSNYAGDARGGGQQTYLLISICGDEAPKNKDQTTFTAGVGQNVYILGAITSGIPPATSSEVPSNGINATVNVQSLNSDGKTWTTLATHNTEFYPMVGFISVKLIPEATGVYTYRLTYDGDSQYSPAISNAVTLTVTNVVIS